MSPSPFSQEKSAPSLSLSKDLSGSSNPCTLVLSESFNHQHHVSSHPYATIRSPSTKTRHSRSLKNATAAFVPTQSLSSYSESKASLNSMEESSVKKTSNDLIKVMCTPPAPLCNQSSTDNMTHSLIDQGNAKHRHKNIVAPAITEYYSASSESHSDSKSRHLRNSINISSVLASGSTSAFQPRPSHSSMRILPPPRNYSSSTSTTPSFTHEEGILPPPLDESSNHSRSTLTTTPHPAICETGVLSLPLVKSSSIQSSSNATGSLKVRKARSASVISPPPHFAAAPASRRLNRVMSNAPLPLFYSKYSPTQYRDALAPPPPPTANPSIYPPDTVFNSESPSRILAYPDGIGPPSTPSSKPSVYHFDSMLSSGSPSRMLVYPDGIAPPTTPPPNQIGTLEIKHTSPSISSGSIIQPSTNPLTCSSDSHSYSGISDDITPPPGIPETGISRVPEWFEKRTAHFIELISTERTYVKLLDRLTLYFQSSIHDNKDLNITRDQQLKLFSNLDQIFELHRLHLLPMLEEISNSWCEGSSVGKIFCEFSSSFKCYVIFLTNHDTAVNLYKELKVKNKSFKRFMEAVEFSKVAEGLSFESLLILPVQRLPRYSLLLNDLIKTTPKEHPDYEYLQKAKNAIGEVITEINSRKKAEENEVKLRELEHLMDVSKGYFEKGKKGRLFHSEGDLQFDGKSYHFFAFEDSVYLTKPNGTKFKIKGLIEIMNSEFTLVEMGIEFMMKKEHHLFSFKTLLERDLFMKYIKESQDVLAEEEEKKSHEHGYNKKDKNPLKSIVKYHMRSASKLSVLKLSEFKKVSGFATLPQNCVMTVNSICEAIDTVSAFLGKFNPQIDMAVKKGLAEVAHCIQQFFVEFMRVFTQYATAYIKIKQIVEILFVTPEFSPFIKTFEEGHSCSIIRLLAIPTEIVSVDTSFLKVYN